MSSKDEKNDKTKDKKEKKKYKQQDGEEGEEPQEREIKMKLTKKESKLRAPVYYVSDKTQVCRCHVCLIICCHNSPGWGSQVHWLYIYACTGYKRDRVNAWLRW